MTTYDEFLQRLAREHAAEVEADRLELRLWALVRGEQRAEARTRRHPAGLELVVTIDGEVEWSQAFSPALVDQLLESAAEAQRRVLLSQGWQPAGPQSS